MVYFMLFGELPYIPQEVTPKAAMAATRAGVPEPRYLTTAHRIRGSDGTSFCRDLLQREPTQRCSATGALGHPYFNAMFDAKKGPAMIDTQKHAGSVRVRHAGVGRRERVLFEFQRAGRLGRRCVAGFVHRRLITRAHRRCRQPGLGAASSSSS
ncbi:unnamed protein product [Prorocentrum cordatum]|uniref:Non-specific serine/threonine protein kinase n=1 Tax=Prorocentrum cordatum TaxID=2364126 RepID=A0ABN9V2T4_9DINO|nr:unnamed protein product [Polarella glacialis]